MAGFLTYNPAVMRLEVVINDIGLGKKLRSVCMLDLSLSTVVL